MLEQLRRAYAALMTTRADYVSVLEEIRTAAEAEQRTELTDDEQTRYTEARDAIALIDLEAEDIGARVEELEADEAAAQRSAELARRVGAPTGSPTGAARVTHEARTYRRDNQRGASFFADAYAQRSGFAPDAEDRLRAHMREARALGEDVESRDVTTDAFGGLIVPQYLVDLFAPNLYAGRPTANAVRSAELPAQGMTLTIPRGTTKTATGEQTTQNTEVTEQDFDETDLVVNVATIAGQQDMSRQSIERGTGNDEIIYADLVEDYATKVNAYVLTKASIGLLNQSGTNSVTYTDADPTVAEIWPKLVNAVTQVNTNRLMPATVAIMHPNRWGWMWAAQDSNGRPLFVGDAPMNPVGLGTAAEYGQVVGSLNGLVPVITDAGIPTNLGAGTEDAILVLRASDPILWEEGNGLPRRLRFEETNGGKLSVKLVVYGYCAFTAGRYPTAVSKITGTGLIAPTF